MLNCRGEGEILIELSLQGNVASGSEVLRHHKHGAITRHQTPPDAMFRTLPDATISPQPPSALSHHQPSDAISPQTPPDIPTCRFLSSTTTLPPSDSDHSVLS
ncbi:unnamed protein product [Pleuronectes platessa]|uniref:Uncharacterized protein n=1 Tax=Pleuronectes platessa TaxID=8262 RepID=A0A9N7YN72_PLEPL|nr:unnamed protein product [Pleuronectes platessa]